MPELFYTSPGHKSARAARAVFDTGPGFGALKAQCSSTAWFVGAVWYRGAHKGFSQQFEGLLKDAKVFCF